MSLVHRPRSSTNRRPVAAALALAAALGSAACTSSTPVHLTGLVGLGASTANWNAAHPGAGPDGSFGPSVNTGAGTKPTYGAVNFSQGHVAGWVMAFATGTTLGAAEHALSQSLPPDVEQTASSRQTGQGGDSVCEVVSYQSVQLQAVAAGTPELGGGRFAVSFYEQERSGTISSSYATVNTAVVGIPRAAPSVTCPA